MKGNKMYFWMMIADVATTILLETMADSGVSEEDFTKEDWEATAPAMATRRKAAANRIRAHSKGVG